MSIVRKHPLVQCDRLELRSWIDAFGVAVAVADVLPDGTVIIVAVNDRFESSFGACVPGRSAADGLPGASGVVLDALFRRCAESGQDVEDELVRETASGIERWTAQIRPAFGRTHLVSRLVCVLFDTTDFRRELDRRDQVIASARAAGRAVLERLDTAALQVSVDGIVLSANACASDWFADGDLIVGRRLDAVGQGDGGPTLSALVTAAITSGTAETAEIGHGSRYLRITADPWAGADGRLAAVTVRAHDVTAEQEARRQADDSCRQIARYQRLASLSDSTAALAHEMAQPLAAVASYCRGAATRVAASGGSDDVSEALAEACKEAERASAILRTLNGFVRPSPGATAGTDLSAILADVHSLLRADLARHAVAFRSDLDPELPLLNADPVELGQVLHNILRNGLEAVAGRDDARLTVQARVDSGAAAITIDDNGSGFADDIRDRLFTPFMSTKGSGLGIGLSVCRSIVERHGGRISAEDAPGGGARVRFSMPLEETSLVA